MESEAIEVMDKAEVAAKLAAYEEELAKYLTLANKELMFREGRIAALKELLAPPREDAPPPPPGSNA